MNTKSVESHIDMSFGFPVIIDQAPMRLTNFGWVLDVNAGVLEGLVLRELTHLLTPLTGAQLKYIRHTLKMNAKTFGARFDFSGDQIIGFEKMEQEPTGMSWTSEKSVRLTLSEHVRDDLNNTFAMLQEKPKKGIKTESIHFGPGELSAAL